MPKIDFRSKDISKRLIYEWILYEIKKRKWEKQKKLPLVRLRWYWAELEVLCSQHMSLPQSINSGTSLQSLEFQFPPYFHENPIVNTSSRKKKKKSCVWLHRKCTKEITNHATPPRPKYNSFLKRARILIWKKKTMSQSFQLKIIWKFFGKPCLVLVFRNNFLFKNKNCCWLDDFWNNQT